MPPKRTASSTETQSNATTFYWADDEKIPLTPSTQYLAVRGAAAAETVARSLSTFAAPTTTLDFPEYNLSVVAVSPGATGAARAGALENARAMIAGATDVEGTPTVYEPAEVAHAEALVPVGEVIARFAPTASDDQIESLLNQHRLTVIKRDYPEPRAMLLRAESDEGAISAANALHEAAGVEYAQPNFVRLQPRLDVQLEESATTMAPTDYGAYRRPDTPITAPDDVSFASPTAEAQRQSALQPSAPTTPGPMAFSDPGFASQWGLQKIGAPDAWAYTMGNASIIVAVI